MTEHAHTHNTKNRNQDPTIAYKAVGSLTLSLSFHLSFSALSLMFQPCYGPCCFPTTTHSCLSLCNLPFPLSRTFFCHISTYLILPLHSSQTSLHQRDLSHASYYQQQPSTLPFSSLLSCFYITCVYTA